MQNEIVVLVNNDSFDSFYHSLGGNVVKFMLHL